jgi:hypothetical protein
LSAIPPRAPGPTAGSRSRDRGDHRHSSRYGTPDEHELSQPIEVFDLAAKVVVDDFPDADLPAAVRSTGHQPRLLVPADVVPQDPTIPTAMINIVRSLLAEVEGTVGVICPPATKAELADELEQAQLAGTERLAVVTPLQSKGLEYDAVLVITPDDIVAESPGGVRALYVALTRPTQRRVTLDAAPDASWRKSLE